MDPDSQHAQTAPWEHISNIQVKQAATPVLQDFSIRSRQPLLAMPVPCGHTLPKQQPQLVRNVQKDFMHIRLSRDHTNACQTLQTLFPSIHLDSPS
jgi:hypothetical protein